jgi:hypothetical protein
MRRVLIEGRWKLALIDYFAGDAFLKGVFAIPSVKSDAKSDERCATSTKKYG